MTSEEIIAVIDALCEKLGLAVSSVGELVPELAAWKTASLGVTIAFSLACCVALIVVATQAYRKGTKMVKKYNESRGYGGLDDPSAYTIWDYENAGSCAVTFVCCIIVAVLPLVAAVLNIISLIGWLTAPNVKAIEYILSLVG